MIDFTSYEEVKLKDVAEFARVKKDKIYPAGTSTIQISASLGETGYLDKPSKLNAKYVAIIPQAGINSKYFNIVLQKNIHQFMSKYATGLNIKAKEVGNFPIQLHNNETQEAIVKFVQFCESEEQKNKMQIEALLKLKKNFQATMFV